jgi:hypothetical protein
MRINFEVVSLRKSVGYKCRGCGKRRTKSVCVENTINPFNKNKDGIPKTYDEVNEDVKREVARRVKEIEAGATCTKCEGADAK